MPGYLIESALLSQGLPGISNGRLREIGESWRQIAWLDNGELRIGDMESFCNFRSKAAGFDRINYFTYDEACRCGLSGPLTASGTMRACEYAGYSLAVSSGIGGLVPTQSIEQSNDLSAMKHSSISLLATAFKDMFDTGYSVAAAFQGNIAVYRLTEYWHGAYLFAENKLSDIIPLQSDSFHRKTLYLAPLMPDQLISDRQVLEEAVQYGKSETARGNVFHLSVNRRIAELTEGYSCELQLISLAENIGRAENMMK